MNMRKKTFSLRVNFIKELSKRKLTVAFAESMTCGLAVHQLVKVKGTKDVLQGGIVCYHQDVKAGLLKVPVSVIEKHSAESREVTMRLARSLRKLIKADIHAAITGLAAPGGSETKLKPVGTVFMAAVFHNEVFTMRKVFRGTPSRIMQKACDETYRFILKVISSS
jgi:nicotinamide-nucleotide amidase